VAYGIATALGAVALGFLALERSRVPRVLRRGTARVLGAPVEALRAAHSGHVGDYVAWLTVGLAVLGVAFSLALR
jgi:multicomponent Na+:H+ antiporter subunit D